jgi:hypothetical protein
VLTLPSGIRQLQHLARNTQVLAQPRSIGGSLLPLRNHL